MKAIISDIHGNLEALRAVLEDIEHLGIKDIVCLGDIVGYGPQPKECLEIVKNITSFTILGNHEEAVLNGVPASFQPRARKAIEWTRKILLEDPMEPQGVRDARREQMAGYKPRHRVEGVLYVHGSPRDPTREYVMPRDATDKKKMTAVFAALDDYCFVGHTHTPGIFTPSGFTHPSDMFDLYMLGTDEKVLVNVGSVGQPRDGDPRACFCTFDGDTVVWRRVTYNIETTCKMIYAIPELDDFLADRLREGR
ncbi:MAG TPA: metallophosphoesterase family protein [Planctomycetota bacterium]|jgi:diadenosine tetraphosphatase ApaH/serine/threonine PP2A family protein phosphatase